MAVLATKREDVAAGGYVEDAMCTRVQAWLGHWCPRRLTGQRCTG